MSRFIIDTSKHMSQFDGIILTSVSGLENADRALEDAYQRGFEDGKAQRTYDDKIEVGDEVTHKSDSVVWTAVCIQIDEDRRHMNLMGPTGSVGYYLVEDFKKTGRHFDILSILEAMRT